MLFLKKSHMNIHHMTKNKLKIFKELLKDSVKITQNP